MIGPPNFPKRKAHLKTDDLEGKELHRSSVTPDYRTYDVAGSVASGGSNRNLATPLRQNPTDPNFGEGHDNWGRGNDYANESCACIPRRSALKLTLMI
jgi:hypothetical protein